MTQCFTRRSMLKKSATAGAALWLGSRGAGIATSYAANNKLNIASIGLGNQGTANLRLMLSQNIVALCDVDDARTTQMAQKCPGAKTYADYRVMLDEMDQEIDGVVVTTPNHAHAAIAIRAMKMGKHVYCEKPLTHTIFEAREMQRVAREQQVITQMGIQIHASANYRRVVETVQSGAIGDVSKVHVWFGKPGGFRRYGRVTEKPPAGTPVPEGFNWDLWIGPAPMTPYHPVYHPHDWHYFWDYGNGSLGNMGCHYMDLVYWALKLKYPDSVETQGPEVHPDSTPFWLDCQWHFPKRGGMAATDVYWYHGRNTPKPVLELGAPEWPAGVLFVGSEGMLVVEYGQHVLLPETKFADFEPPPQTIPAAIGNHREEWFEACKGNGKALAHFDYAAPLTETILLGNLAFRMGSKIVWDGDNMQATNNPEAAKYIKTEYRKGWTSS